jgi:hypothetical protein
MPEGTVITVPSNGAPTSAQTLTPEQLAAAKLQARIKELHAELDKLEPADETLDKFGRTKAERTIELETDDAEAVDQEVEAGKHQTFADAHHYQLERGRAEIHRQRESLKALKVQRDDARAMSALRTACANNPDLMTNPAKLADVMKSLGIKLSN